MFHKYLISLFLSNPPLFHCKQTAAELIRLADFLKLYLCNHVEYEIGQIRWIFTERLEANWIIVTLKYYTVTSNGCPLFYKEKGGGWMKELSKLYSLL